MSRKRKIAKIIVWMFAGLVILIGVFIATLQIVFTENRTTSLVNRYAAEYIDGELKFGKVSVNFLRHFPKATLHLSDVVLTYPSDRFAELEEKYPEAILLQSGKGVESDTDTLARLDRFTVSLNLATLISGKDISVSDVRLTRPRIFAKAYNDSTFNWNVLLIPESEEEEDTTKSGIPAFSIDGLSLEKNPHIIFCYPEKKASGIFDVADIGLKGKFSSTEIGKNKVEFNIDSLYLAGRYGADTVLFAADRLNLKKGGASLKVELESDLFAATRQTGRIQIPLAITLDSRFRETPDTTYLDIDRLEMNLAHIPVTGRADLKTDGSGIRMKGNLSTDGFQLSTLIDEYGHLFDNDSLELSTDAEINLSAEADGLYDPENGKIPEIRAVLSVPDAGLSSRFTARPLELGILAEAETEGNRLDASLKRMFIRTSGKGAGIDIAGKASDLLGSDPSISVSGNLEADLDALMKTLRDSLDFQTSGTMSGDFKGQFRISDLKGGLDRLAACDLKANLRGTGLNFDSPADTINAGIDSLDVLALSMGNIYDRDLPQGTRVLGVQLKAGNIQGRFKNFEEIKVGGLDIRAQNSARTRNEDGNPENKGFRPFSVLLSADAINVKDKEKTAVDVKNTHEIFKIYPKQDIHNTPVVKIIGNNQEISYKDVTSRVILSDLAINGSAVMNTYARRKFINGFRDSLRRAHPEMTKDSLQNYIEDFIRKRSRSNSYGSDDFKDHDIDLNLDQTLKQYYKNWDLSGNLVLAEARLITPMLPLKNTLSNVKGSFTNNTIKISDFEANSGKSELKADATLTGLRKLILAKGDIDLTMNVKSDNLNVDELINAFYRGQYLLEKQKEMTRKAEGITDEQYQKMIEKTEETVGEEEIQTGPIVIPGNLKTTISLDAGNIVFNGITVQDMKSDIAVQDRCMQFTNTSADSDIGKFNFEGFYSSWSRKDIMAGINLEFKDITAEKVIELFPAADTLMPLLKAFKGKLSCEMAATSNLDTTMNFIIPTLNGIIRIKGKDMMIEKNDAFKPIARLLNIKTKQNTKIQNLSVEGLISDSKLEIFPFTFELDKYKLAMSGVQYLDMSFKYHITVLKSPFPFRIGMDLSGPDFDNMKFRLGKPKYKNNKIPVFTKVIDETKVNLTESIHEIFQKGVSQVLQENRQQKAINNMKNEINYIPAVEIPIDSLDTAEKTGMENFKNVMENVDEIITPESNEQSRIY